VIDNAGAQVLTMLKPSRSCQVHRARLERMSQLRDKNPVRQYCSVGSTSLATAVGIEMQL